MTADMRRMSEIAHDNGWWYSNSEHGNNSGSNTTGNPFVPIVKIRLKSSFVSTAGKSL